MFWNEHTFLSNQKSLQVCLNFMWVQGEFELNIFFGKENFFHTYLSNDRNKIKMCFLEFVYHDSD